MRRRNSGGNSRQIWKGIGRDSADDGLSSPSRHQHPRADGKPMVEENGRWLQLSPASSKTFATKSVFLRSPIMSFAASCCIGATSPPSQEVGTRSAESLGPARIDGLHSNNHRDNAARGQALGSNTNQRGPKGPRKNWTSTSSSLLKLNRLAVRSLRPTRSTSGILPMFSIGGLFIYLVRFGVPGPLALITPALFSRPPPFPTGEEGEVCLICRALSPLSPVRWGEAGERGRGVRGSPKGWHSPSCSRTK